MAKQRRIKSGRQLSPSDAENRNVLNPKSDGAPPKRHAADSESDAKPSKLDPMAFVVALLAGALVYVCYHPSDSVSVEKGDALWFGMLSLVIATAGLSYATWQSRDQANPENRDAARQNVAARRWLGASVAIDALAWSLALWIMLSAWMTCPPGNLRMATNEAWLWISGAAMFTAARRLLLPLEMRQAIIALMLVCTTGLAIHGLHQEWISLPQSRADYRENPDELLAQAGIDAPEGSADRMVFENRLFDGGPTGTFALANSMAAALLVGCIIAFGVLRNQFRACGTAERVFWIAILTLTLACLWAARSRSATVACVLGVVAVYLGAFLVPNDAEQNSAASVFRRFGRLLMMGLAGLSVLTTGVVLLIAAIGKREWFEQAPASIAFRFQYWRSTWRLAVERPLFGAGPGNFQSIYERYREPSANEQIADPHNWFFETLASGGFVAAAFLLGLAACCVYVAVKDRQVGLAEIPKNPTVPTGDAKWIWLGAGLSLIMVWLLGAASGRTPDFDASLIVVPVSIGAAVLIWRLVRNCDSRCLDWIAAVSLLSLMLHLLAAGGWTVPGVAIHIWLLAGILTRTGSRKNIESKPHAVSNDDNETPTHRKLKSSNDPKTQRRTAQTLGIAAIGLLLLGALRLMSLGPVEAKGRAMRTAEYAQAKRQSRAMEVAIGQAIRADTWSPDASLYLADVLHWKLVILGESTSIRKQWNSTLQQALDRAGETPSAYRTAALQHLHLYQRWGDAMDLQTAADILEQAADWSPANQWIVAQLSAVRDEQGDHQKATELAEEANYLSELGGNAERALSRQMIYRVQPLGKAANSGAKLYPASELQGLNRGESHDH